jgi:hypothetical protein
MILYYQFCTINNAKSLRLFLRIRKDLEEKVTFAQAEVTFVLAKRRDFTANKTVLRWHRVEMA